MCMWKCFLQLCTYKHMIPDLPTLHVYIYTRMFAYDCLVVPPPSPPTGWRMSKSPLFGEWEMIRLVKYIWLVVRLTFWFSIVIISDGWLIS